jgi:capsid protein
MIYGSEYRVDNMRGLPILACVLETIKKIDRYKEATVGSAEERQKLAYYITHGVNSTGENPILQAREALGKKVEDPQIEKLITKTKQAVKLTVGKTAINMPNDSDLKMLESKNELFFKDFYDTNFIYLCAALIIPPEVALNKYDSNYSASRAAIKSWENRIKVERWEIGFSYYQNIYNLWLEIQVLSNKINAPSYIQSLLSNNFMAVEAYQSARWIGSNMPHIDPLKEVLAVRKALGDDTTLLTTYEFASEFLNMGDWETIIKQVKEEKSRNGIKEPIIPEKKIIP